MSPVKTQINAHQKTQMLSEINLVQCCMQESHLATLLLMSIPHCSPTELPPTCGGGSPPAPGGHTGSIFLIFSLLHSQDGEGFCMLLLPFKNMLRTDSGTEAVVHSFCPTVQGVSLCLERGKTKAVFKTNMMVFAYKAFKDQTPQSPEEAVCCSKELDLTETNSSEQQIRLSRF